MPNTNNLNSKCRLQEYHNKFESIISLFDNLSANKQLIAEYYKELKQCIKSEIKSISKSNSKDITNFLLPALNEALGDMKVKTNGNVDNKMQDCLFSALSYINYYLGLMN